MSAHLYVIKFYETQKDFDNKNPFHMVEISDELEEVQKKAEEIKVQINAHSYKIKEKLIG